ncbi:TPA: LuxR C-terminal-related transcriptional regulator [Serratia fonticola]|jgi:DNA-binding NarL/FixJ family response regulator|uniref:response regulator transcription factor n=1 Tax=Serratia TaxID=613 RepID=UPI000EF451B1|nr:MULTISPECIES: LuxR C-terminal-related transcriptional regulator [Serratia]AYM91145.1 LuxR family transcriptional regulator [Serratia sp. 3ACOL1]MBL5862254.1 LuxR family transcriptional regulator [Serratia fonticola]MBL5903729.1 LuxR family transcriptional regulator [Serratia fonticola]MDK2374340.1 LuxR C-terminal-related transcriptional regulator [Serratia fonticola]CAI0997831.1 two component system sensor kinase SsrB [Serratia fonticola]
MITIISDDSYFVLGAQALLTHSGYQVATIDIHKLNRPVNSQQNDIILLSSNNRNLIHNVLLFAGVENRRVIQMIDGNTPSDMWADGVLSKKTATHEFPRIIKYILNLKVKDCLKDLTLREVEIMDKLLKGKKNHAISREMRISEKTVSAHKLNALKKLGLTGLNSRAILIYGSYQNRLQMQRSH